MLWGLIEPNGRIAQVEAEPFPVAAPLEWVEVPEGTEPESTWDGATVTPPDRRRGELLSRLALLDLESLRPLRAIQAGTATDYDRDKLAALDAEAAVLRTELEGLNVS